jgi:hypothetical protein
MHPDWYGSRGQKSDRDGKRAASLTPGPFLRCLQGLALCWWRLGEIEKAKETMRRLIWLNPEDNQGVRFLWGDINEGLTWEQSAEKDACGGV